MFTGMTYVYLLSVLLLARITLQASSPTSTHYVGAVVEYHPVHNEDNATATVNQNKKNYMKFLQTASENEVDIIVFPEASLMGGLGSSENNRSPSLSAGSYIPDPKDAKVPCTDQSSNVNEVVKALSCAAKSFAMYVVVNLHEKEKCTGDKCPKDGHMLYNTNVAFDRTGTVVGRYRKWNLFGERGFNRTTKPELSYFRTDFNVTFGQFICFDILFDTPALSLVREKRITDILFSTYWFGELPYLTANEIQSGYSYANDVNFLGAGFNSPSTGSGGSGIYAGKDGVLGRIVSEKRTNAMIIANIPKIVNGRRVQSVNPNDAKIIVYSTSDIPTINGSEPVPQMAFKTDDMKPYTTKLFNPTNNTHNLTLCDREFCCHFQIRTEHREDLVKDSVKYYRYRLAVFNGVRSFGVGGTGGVEVCSIISCIDDKPTSCGQRFDTNTIIVHPTTFNSIIISSDYKISRNISRFPLSLNTEMNPFNVSDFTFISNKLNATHVNIKYTLTKPRKDLMTFAIYGRNFTSDGQPITTSSAAQFSPLYIMLIMLIALGITKTYGMSSM
ncbi:hypothetical protein PV325_010891 [Microctonus aethiopoides]|uniref:CN hydrolase domain-containing protein n=1 Tax=Microctonus aethiopoides TaxID=144406 RepID=A0AA39FV77_9HYME|nr:hypothetical protein PV325_010891 [Microctonus aethiopoides]KAK0176146.1 hypothetical protein PV328_000313 [Microctonus aethiopoides]